MSLSTDYIKGGGPLSPLAKSTTTSYTAITNKS